MKETNIMGHMSQKTKTNKFRKTFVVPATLILALSVGCKKNPPVFAPAPPPSTATFTPVFTSTATPIGGGAGVVAFSSNRHDPIGSGLDIYTVNIDGTNLQRLTNSGVWSNWGSEWSQDGTQVAFFSNRAGSEGVYTINSNGTNETLILASLTVADISWSPDGSKIMVSRGTPADLWTMNPDGTGLVQLLVTAESELSSDWSPDGTKIVYERDGHLYTMNSNGTGMAQITNAGGSGLGDHMPQWSPDGVRISFWSSRFGGEKGFIVNPDGTGETQIFDPEGRAELEPNWSPDGTKVVYSGWDGIYTMYPDATAPTTVIQGPVNAFSIYPAWK